MTDLRSVQVSNFSAAWAQASDAGVELERCFSRLAEHSSRLSRSGLHVLVEFQDALTQAAWVAYRESRGDLIPVHPEEAPIPR